MTGCRYASERGEPDGRASRSATPSTRAHRPASHPINDTRKASQLSDVPPHRGALQRLVTATADGGSAGRLPARTVCCHARRPSITTERGSLRGPSRGGGHRRVVEAPGIAPGCAAAGYLGFGLARPACAAHQLRGNFARQSVRPAGRRGLRPGHACERLDRALSVSRPSCVAASTSIGGANKHLNP